MASTPQRFKQEVKAVRQNRQHQQAAGAHEEMREEDEKEESFDLEDFLENEVRHLKNKIVKLKTFVPRNSGFIDSDDEAEDGEENERKAKAASAPPIPRAFLEGGRGRGLNTTTTPNSTFSSAPLLRANSPEVALERYNNNKRRHFTGGSSATVEVSFSPSSRIYPYSLMYRDSQNDADSKKEDELRQLKQVTQEKLDLEKMVKKLRLQLTQNAAVLQATTQTVKDLTRELVAAKRQQPQITRAAGSDSGPSQEQAKKLKLAQAENAKLREALLLAVPTGDTNYSESRSSSTLAKLAGHLALDRAIKQEGNKKDDDDGDVVDVDVPAVTPPMKGAKPQSRATTAQLAGTASPGSHSTTTGAVGEKEGKTMTTSKQTVSGLNLALNAKRCFKAHGEQRQEATAAATTEENCSEAEVQRVQEEEAAKRSNNESVVSKLQNRLRPVQAGSEQTAGLQEQKEDSSIEAAAKKRNNESVASRLQNRFRTQGNEQKAVVEKKQDQPLQQHQQEKSSNERNTIVAGRLQAVMAARARSEARGEAQDATQEEEEEKDAMSQENAQLEAATRITNNQSVVSKLQSRFKTQSQEQEAEGQTAAGAQEREQAKQLAGGVKAAFAAKNLFKTRGEELKAREDAEASS